MSLPDPPPLPMGRYRHFKGNEYEVVGLARDSETLEWKVIYKPLYNDSGWWVRPYTMFIETITHQGKQIPRFEKID